MSFDLSSWLWWRLVSLVLVVLTWLLLAFGVGAVPLSVRQSPATQPEFEAAGQSFAVEPREGRLDWSARRFESQSAKHSALAISVSMPRPQGRLQ